MFQMRVTLSMLTAVIFLLYFPANAKEYETKVTQHHEKEHHAHGYGVETENQKFSGSLSKGFNDMTPGEVSVRLRSLAKMIDANQNGFVTETELREWIYHSLVSIDSKETEERFDEIDADKNEGLTWSEFLQEAFGVEPGNEAQSATSDPRDVKLINEDRRYFTVADQDNDGLLNREEFVAFQSPEHFPHMHQVLIENTLLDKDTDGDGRIDIKEFLGEIYDQPNSEWGANERARFENEYDLDNDGYLTGNELKNWLVPDTGTTSGQEAKHLIKVADTDKDGQLSIEEIVNAQEAFVGSEATSYGDKLAEIPHEEL